MDNEKLRSLAAVVRNGSIAAAARELYISQQALSKTIAGLEAELGVPLIERSNRGVEPTEYGLIAVESSRVIEQELSALRGRIESLSAGKKAVLRLGLAEPIGFSELYFRDLVRFCASRGIDLSAQHFSGAECIELLIRREIDLACVLSADGQFPSGIDARWLCRLPLYLTIDGDMPFAEKQHLAPHDAESLVLPCEDILFQRIIEAAFAHAELPMPELRSYDRATDDFAMFCLTQCNGTLVAPNIVRLARSNAHVVRSFPPDGWFPSIYLLTAEGEAPSGTDVVESFLWRNASIERSTLIGGEPLTAETEERLLAAPTGNCSAPTEA